MKRYLFTTLPSNDLGLLAQSLPIARELKLMGHQVAFCSPGMAPRKLISDSGFDNIIPGWAPYSIQTGETRLSHYFRLLCSRHPLRDIGILMRLVDHVKNRSSAEVWNADHFMYMMGLGDTDYLRTSVNALRGVIDRYNPDAIVDFWNPCTCIAARACRKPLVTVIQADLHPQGRGFIWWKKPPKGLPTVLPTINSLLAEYSLRAIDTAGELHVGDMTLVIGIPEMGTLPDTADVTYIGPILWQKQNARLPDWIEGLSGDQPVIWLYAGNPKYIPGSESPYDSIVIIQACIEALQNLPVQVVLSTGHQSLPDSLLPLPVNFRHTSFVPGLSMASRSDLMIHHGGYGSCQTGLYTGTPSVIIPTFSERESNARRMAATGAGDFILPDSDASGRNKRIDVEKLRSMVIKVLSDPSYKENAMRMKKRMHSLGGAPEAARLINGFIKGLPGINEN